MNDKQPILERLNYQASSATIHGMAGFAGTMLDAAQHITIIEQSNTALQECVKELEMDKIRVDFMLKYWLIVWHGKAVVKRSVIDAAMNQSK